MSASGNGAVLDRAVRRLSLDDHDGRSGATLERVVLDDGTALIVKTAPAGVDLAGVLTGDGARELALWTAGVLDDLPSGVGHAIVDAWQRDDGTVVTVMRDLGTSVIGWRAISLAECDRIFRAVTAVHRSFAGRAIGRCCALERRLTLLAPRLTSGVDSANPLPGLIERGWAHFADLAPTDVATEIFALLEYPQPLADALRRSGTTLLHGDLTLVNVAFEENTVVLLDWGIATEGPSAFDLVTLLASSASCIDAPREAVVDLFRRRSGELHDEPTLCLALVAGLLELGWNKALDIAENPAIAERERADLDWWIAHARAALDTIGL